jgi:hypothetical protein
MGRGLSAKRDLRNRKIRRSKRIDHSIHDTPWYNCDGKYSKGKIFCDCGLCKPKWAPLPKSLRYKEILQLEMKDYKSIERNSTDEIFS